MGVKERWMAQWMKTLRLTPEWDQAKRNSITTQQLARVVSDRIKIMGSYDDEDIEERRLELAESFLDFSNDGDSDVEDFDYLMQDLYDWADTPMDTNWNGKKVAWVGTF